MLDHKTTSLGESNAVTKRFVEQPDTLLVICRRNFAFLRHRVALRRSQRRRHSGKHLGRIIPLAASGCQGGYQGRSDKGTHQCEPNRGAGAAVECCSPQPLES
jgi:hypothetical protein